MSTNADLTKKLAGKTVESVRSRGTELNVDFEDGTTLTVTLASEGDVSVEK